MKEIVISALLLASLLAGITANGAFVCEFAEFAADAAEKLPTAEDAHCPSAVDEFDAYWQKKKAALSFSISYDDIERITEKLRLLKVAALSGDRMEFELQRKQLITAIEHATRLERISFESIF